MKTLVLAALLALALSALAAPFPVLAAEPVAAKYVCPMHPQIVSGKPGKCPICGMDLVPVAGGEHVHGETQKESSAVLLSPSAVQKTGVRTEKAAKTMFGGILRAPGVIRADERARVDVFTQVEGRVEGLKHAAAGEEIRKGEMLYSLVSPELDALQGDYLAARAGGLDDLADAARRRLHLLGVTDGMLRALEQSRRPFAAVPFLAPASGILSALEARNGGYLMAGDPVARIQDLSSVWIEAEIPEGDAAIVSVGDSARITVAGRAQAYESKVDYVYPAVAAETRSVKARLEVENADGFLKPGAFASVEFSASATERLSVPSAAILRDSAGARVIVALGEGRFQPRAVETGLVSAGRTEILSGLRDGEEVVTSSQFLIDSESSLREALERIDAPKAQEGGAHGQH